MRIPDAMEIGRHLAVDLRRHDLPDRDAVVALLVEEEQRCGGGVLAKAVGNGWEGGAEENARSSVLVFDDQAADAEDGGTLSGLDGRRGAMPREDQRQSEHTREDGEQQNSGFETTHAAIEA
jgi:hypothetical protein